MSTNIMAPRPIHTPAVDLEAQQPVAFTYNPNVTRAKIAAMALVSTAGALAGAILATAGQFEATAPAGRQLQENSLLPAGCTPKQLANIETAKEALIISGITTAAGIGGSILGGIIYRSGCLSAQIGGALLNLGALTSSLGTSAVLISGIIYGVKKNDC